MSLINDLHVCACLAQHLDDLGIVIANAHSKLKRREVLEVLICRVAIRVLSHIQQSLHDTGLLSQDCGMQCGDAVVESDAALSKKE